ncbi:MAG: hypothetical protein ABIH03_02380 [Pseudomonadota bacterium]
MSHDKVPLQFPAQSNVPVIGAPFTIQAVSVPTNLTLQCNCGGEQTTVEILASVPTACPSCGKVYHAAFNPIAGKLEVKIGVPQVVS